MTRQLTLLACAALVGVSTLAARQQADPSYAPQRVNRAIELLEQGQPIYYAQVNGGGYDEGKALAQTWADYITYNLEHSPFNMTDLRAFMRGLVDGGPTVSTRGCAAVAARGSPPASGASRGQTTSGWPIRGHSTRMGSC